MASTGTTPQPIALPPDLEEGAGPRILTFTLGARIHGCRLDGVREIVTGRPATRLPGAAPHVSGLLNLRGTVVTVIDLAALLVPGREARHDGHVVIVEVEGRLAGCRVDAVDRVVPEPPLDLPPSGGNADPGGIVMGVGEVGGELVAVLDLIAAVRQTLLFPGER